MDVRVESDGRIVVEDEECLYGYDIGKTTFERYNKWILWRDELEGDQAFLFENAQGLEKVWEGIQKCLRCQAATTDPGGGKIEHRLKFQPVLDDIAGGSDGAREKARKQGIKERKQEKTRESKRKQKKASKRKQEKARESKRKQDKTRQNKTKQESNRKQQEPLVQGRWTVSGRCNGDGRGSIARSALVCEDQSRVWDPGGQHDNEEKEGKRVDKKEQGEHLGVSGGLSSSWAVLVAMDV
jgi:hypothetical protein